MPSETRKPLPLEPALPPTFGEVQPQEDTHGFAAFVPGAPATGGLEVLREGGDWLGTVRRWIQSNKINGEQVTWGSSDALRGPVTVRELEEVAAYAVASDRRVRSTVPPAPAAAETTAGMIPSDVSKAKLARLLSRLRRAARDREYNKAEQCELEITAMFSARANAAEAERDAMKAELEQIRNLEILRLARMTAKNDPEKQGVQHWRDFLRPRISWRLGRIVISEELAAQMPCPWPKEEERPSFAALQQERDNEEGEATYLRGALLRVQREMDAANTALAVERAHSADLHRQLCEAREEGERAKKALRLVDGCFVRSNANDDTTDYMGDDEHEAWNAVRTALAPVE